MAIAGLFAGGLWMWIVGNSEQVLGVHWESARTPVALLTVAALVAVAIRLHLNGRRWSQAPQPVQKLASGSLGQSRGIVGTLVVATMIAIIRALSSGG